MKKTIYPWINILLGCTILAAGFVFFINPYNIIPGGVSGRSVWSEYCASQSFPFHSGGYVRLYVRHPAAYSFSRFARSQAGVAYHSGCLGYTFYNEYAVAGGLSYAGSPGGT